MANKWKAELTVPKNLLNLEFSTGDLLAYLAAQVVDTINERTNKGLDVNGAAFKPYRPVFQYTKDEDKGGAYRARDEKGRWKELRGPQDPVRLYGIDPDVHDGKHMRDNLRWSPRRPRPNAKSVTVQYQGARQGLRHRVRAMSVSRGSREGVKFQSRPFVGITDAEWSRILGSIRKDHVLAFVKAEKAIAARKHVMKAKRAQERARRARKAAAKRASRGAKAQKAAHDKRIKALGIKREESTQQAYKRRQRAKRTARREKRAAKKGAR